MNTNFKNLYLEYAELELSYELSSSYESLFGVPVKDTAFWKRKVKI